MTVEYLIVAIGAVAIVAVSIWNKVQIWKRIRAIDLHLAKMQTEIDVLQMQESRRLMMELKASSKAEAPKIDPANGTIDLGGDEVVRLVKTPPTTPAQ